MKVVPPANPADQLSSRASDVSGNTCGAASFAYLIDEVTPLPCDSLDIE